MYHYTYLLLNQTTLMMYIGKRSCNCLPEEDVQYMGSSKYVPKEQCTKTILKTFSSSREAVQHEIYLHNLHDVGVNPMFYNRSKQTSTKFDTTGVSTSHSEETKAKLSKAKKGIVPNWSTEGKKIIQANLAKGKTPEARAKAGASTARNGSNKGTKNAGFRPWYISTDAVTYLYTDISKAELSVLEGHYSKYYADVQKVFNRNGTITTNAHGKIIDMGFLPKQYKI